MPTTTLAPPAAPAPVGNRLRGAAARVAGLLATPLTPADFIDVVAPLRSPGALRARVVTVRPETATAATVTLQPSRSWAGHTPGQYLRLGVDVDGVRHWRSYSITSRPGERLLQITVQSVAGGVVSPHLVHALRPGTVVQLAPAAGTFTLPDPRPARLLFVTAGSGITPVMGLLRSHAAELDDVVVVHSAPRATDVIFGAELRALRGVRLVELHTRVEGRLTPQRLAALVPDLTDRDAYACGPAGLLDTLEAWWPTPRLRTERFTAAVRTADAGLGGTVRFTRTGTTTDADGATPLLGAGEAAGVLMPSGCRMGICFGCVLPLRAGAVRDLRTGAVTTAGDGVLVQTCVSAAAGPCELDA